MLIVVFWQASQDPAALAPLPGPLSLADRQRLGQQARSVWLERTGRTCEVVFIETVSRELLPLLDQAGDSLAICDVEQWLLLRPLVHDVLLIESQPDADCVEFGRIDLAKLGFVEKLGPIDQPSGLWQRPSPVEVLRSLVASGGCDLHLHTTASDGSDSADELYERVKASQLSSFAVTDHDVLDSIDPLAHRVAADPKPPVFVPGVEISVSEGRELHVLGYFPCGGHDQLAHFLSDQRRARHRRNEAMVEKLRSLGYQLTLEQLIQKGQGVVGRVQAAQLLTDYGYTASTAEAFEKVLGFGKPGYVERPRPSLAEAIWQIRRCGGVPVLAHPALYRWCSGSAHVSDRLIHHLAQAKASGLLGVEAYHGEASPAIWQEVAAAGRFLGLLCTAGSDDHGTNKINTTMYTGDRQFLADRELLVVGALVSREDKPGKPRYLLARRSSPGHGKGSWELPGGKVEPGETPKAALKREIAEELDVQATVGPLRRLLIHSYEGFRVILACFEVHLDSLSFKLSAHDKTSWRTAREALRMKLLAADVGLFRELSQL